jgi:hypothetical protein
LSVLAKACAMLFGHAHVTTSGLLRAHPSRFGQGLESLSLDAFDLEVTNDICSIQGTPTQKESEEPTVPKLNAFKKAFLGIVTVRKQPRHPPVLPKGLLGRLPRSYCNLRMPTLTSSNETDRRYAQIGSAAPYHIACQKCYGRSVGMLTARKVS